MPPKSPEVKDLNTQLANPLLNLPAAIKFTINQYSEYENIKRALIYRSTEEKKTISLSLMKHVATLDLTGELPDDFQDLDFAPYGENIYYRIIVQREITNENGNTEFISSYPSGVLEATLVDNINPPAPELNITYNQVAGPPPELQDVKLEWDKTVHNGKYYLYKMNEAGNWNKIYEISSNDAALEVDLVTTSYNSGTLLKEDADSDEIFHRFKVVAENASGLLSLEGNDKVV